MVQFQDKSWHRRSVPSLSSWLVTHRALSVSTTSLPETPSDARLYARFYWFSWSGMSESNDAIVERANSMRRSIFIGRCGVCLQISVPYLAQM